MHTKIERAMSEIFRDQINEPTIAEAIDVSFNSWSISLLESEFIDIESHLDAMLYIINNQN